MKAHQKKELFEKNYEVNESNILKFDGVEGFDVYNCSQPFKYKNKQYLYGRVSREDELRAYFGYFYYGKELENLKYFTTVPENMKDIRLVQLGDGRIGVFSRPRSKELIATYGSEFLVGFTVIDSLDELTAEAITKAKIIPGLFGDVEWGGVNQAYLLENDDIGVIGHLSYQDGDQSVYSVISFVLDYENLKVHDYQIIATRKNFPEGPAKRDHLHDCCFPSGIVPIEGTDEYLLYSGIGDTQEGVVKINYPFKDYDEIVV